MMINSKQLIVGNATEDHIVDWFKAHHYWAYQTAKKTGGQPVDLILGRDNMIYLVDAKHVRSEDCSFSLSRVEPNQWTTMEYAEEWSRIDKTHMGFAIEFDRTEQIYWLGYEKALEMLQNGQKSVNLNKLSLIDEVMG